MAKIVTRRRYKPYVPQIISALIIIITIIISNSPLPISSKISIYLGCFLSDFKIIEICTKGYQVEIQYNDWSNKLKQKTVSRIYEEVKKFVIDNQKASESLIERTFNVNYEIADAIMDQLEKEGVVGPCNDYLPRKVLIGKSKQS